MISHVPFDGWGNMLLQQCFARALGEELDYQVHSRKIPYLVNSGNYNMSGRMFNEPTVNITHTSKYRHYVNIDELKNMTPCRFNIRSYLEYYPNIEKYRNKIVNDWVYIKNPLTRGNIKPLHGRFYSIDNNKSSTLKPVDITHVNDDDIVLSIRLGRDYLGMHKYRLLLGDYFRIVLNAVEYNRLFITSQDPFNPILRNLYEYNPIFLEHVSPMHTFNFVRLFNKIALSQSTYSWWAAYLSDASEIYFPITKDGPWSYGKNQKAKWKDFKHDLMVDEPRYKYVSYTERQLLGDYSTTKDYLY